MDKSQYEQMNKFLEELKKVDEQSNRNGIQKSANFENYPFEYLKRQSAEKNKKIYELTKAMEEKKKIKIEQYEKDYFDEVQVIYDHIITKKIETEESSFQEEKKKVLALKKKKNENDIANLNIPPIASTNNPQLLQLQPQHYLVEIEL